MNEAIASVQRMMQEESAAETVEAPESTETPAEAPAEAQAPTEAEEVPQQASVARGWAAIKAQERKVREERDAMKREKALAADGTAFKQKLKEDPLAALQEAGIDFNELAERVFDPESAKAKAADPQKAVMSEVDRLKQEIAAMKQEGRQKEYAEHDRKYMSDIDSNLASEEFAVLRANPNAKKLVFDAALAHASQTGEIVSPAEICRVLQETLIEELKAISSNDAVKKLLGLNVAVEAPAAKPAVKTISKNLVQAATASPSAQDESSPRNDHEKVARAAKLVETIWRG
jgi:hypothetical protein